MRRIVSRLRLAIKHELSASRGRRRVRYENHWVAEGVLHWEEMVEPFEAAVGEFLGHQTIYYTPKGEEWRIRASRPVDMAGRIEIGRLERIFQAA